MSKMTLDGYEDVTPDDIRAFQRDHAAGVTTETFPEWYARARGRIQVEPEESNES